VPELGEGPCTVGQVGVAADGTETPAPAIYLQLTDGQNRWNGVKWFFAADSSKREILAVALMARSLNRSVTAEVDAPNVNPDGSQGPLTVCHRLYLD
jgi:hypothetical protein